MASQSIIQRSRHGWLAALCLSVIAIGGLGLYLLVDSKSVGDLPPLTLDAIDDELAPKFMREHVDLRWQHPFDQFEAPLGWPTRMGPFHNGIAPEKLQALPWDQQLPAQVWSLNIGRGYSSAVLDSVGRLVVHFRDDDQEIVECRASADGSLIWRGCYETRFEQPNRKYTDGPIATPVINGDCVFTLGVEGVATCWKLNSGEVVWQRDLSDDYHWDSLAFGVGTSPVIFQDQLIIAIGASSQGAGVISLHGTSGVTNWESTSHGASYSTPQVVRVHDQDHLLCLTDVGLTSLKPSTGEERWSIPFRSRIPDSENACSPIVIDDHVLVSAYGMGCLCIRLQPDGSCEEVWRDHKRPVLDVHYNNMIGLNGFAYGFSAIDRTFRVVDIKSGELATKHRSRMRRGYILKVGDGFVLFGEHGYLTVLKFEDQKLVSIADSSAPLIEYPCYSAPAFYQGKLYVRNETTLACFDLTRQEVVAKEASKHSEH